MNNLDMKSKMHAARAEKAYEKHDSEFSETRVPKFEVSESCSSYPEVKHLEPTGLVGHQSILGPKGNQSYQGPLSQNNDSYGRPASILTYHFQSTYTGRHCKMTLYPGIEPFEYGHNAYDIPLPKDNVELVVYMQQLFQIIAEGLDVDVTIYDKVLSVSGKSCLVQLINNAKENIIITANNYNYGISMPKTSANLSEIVFAGFNFDESIRAQLLGFHTEIIKFCEEQWA